MGMYQPSLPNHFDAYDAKKKGEEKKVSEGVFTKDYIGPLYAALQDVIAACVRREKLMMVTENTEQLLKLCDPHFGDSFVWRDLHPDVLRRAKKLAGVLR